MSISSWLIQNLVKGNSDQYVPLSHIKAKYPHKISSMAVGNSVTAIFPGVVAKTGRDEEDWSDSKRTQRYYGVCWRKDDCNENCSPFNFELPDDFFVITRTEQYVKLGHFMGELNDQKILCEIILKYDKTWHFIVMGKTIYPGEVNIDSDYKMDSVFDIVRQIKYCEGLLCKPCKKLLPFNNSNQQSKSCEDCRKRKEKVGPTNGNDVCVDGDGDDMHNMLTLNEEDHSDMSIVFKSIFPECTEKMKCFLNSQKLAMERHPKGRRWDRDIVRLCLTLWSRSPRGYRELRNSNFLILPSEKVLQIFKNKVHQEAGLNSDMLHWMANEAQLKNLPPEGYEGGLIFDEMSIQPDLQFSSRNGNIELIGFTELGPESLVFQHMKSQTNERVLATHVLQLVFLGFTGFRFPFAHFPSITASGHELYLIFWKAVNRLLNFGFTVQYISTDGAQTNRDLLKVLLPQFKSFQPITCAFNDIYSHGKKIFFIMDISHTIKKNRNNVSKSGDECYCSRKLQHEHGTILWNHFKHAYEWDISTHPFPVHHRLTRDHFYFTSEAKMRNHLAEEVLNDEMLHLMEIYKDSLGNDGCKLNATIKLLKSTSVLIKNFRDPRPIISTNDERLIQNNDVMQFFMKWENDNLTNNELTNKEKSLISHQTRQDIISSILGFEELCAYKLSRSNCSIIPSRINSDVIENIFCQQRTLHNGANSNPSYLGYCHSMNSVILGQASISRKSNAGPVQEQETGKRGVLQQQNQNGKQL